MLKRKDTPLFDIVFQEISKSPHHAISFSSYMECALYHSEYGYYGGDAWKKIGRDGDFFTSVSVGPLFGGLLARALHRTWTEELDPDEPWLIVEQGAHDGRLARDIVAALRELGVASPDYRIIEPREGLRRRLTGALAADFPEITVVGSRREASGRQGIFLCNELLDAFPVDCLVFRAGEWKEKCVGVAEDGTGLDWVERSLPEKWHGLSETLGCDYPEGYTTERCVGVEDWMQSVAGLFDRGQWWIIDYGLDQESYYAPHRSSGTLQGYHQHQRVSDPFLAPGEVDLTAHVNFTQLREAAEAAGLHQVKLTDQSSFLVEAARPWLLSLEGRMPTPEQQSLLRQFQMLSHPATMGSQFQVSILAK